MTTFAAELAVDAFAIVLLLVGVGAGLVWLLRQCGKASIGDEADL